MIVCQFHTKLTASEFVEQTRVGGAERGDNDHPLRWYETSQTSQNLSGNDRQFATEGPPLRVRFPSLSYVSNRHRVEAGHSLHRGFADVG